MKFIRIIFLSLFVLYNNICNIHIQAIQISKTNITTQDTQAHTPSSSSYISKFMNDSLLLQNKAATLIVSILLLLKQLCHIVLFISQVPFFFRPRVLFFSRPFIFFPDHITAPVSDYGYRNFIFTATVNITVPVKHLVSWGKKLPRQKKVRGI